MNEKWQTGVPGSQVRGCCCCFWARLRCSVAHPHAQLRAWLCQAAWGGGRAAWAWLRCWRWKGPQPPLLPQRLAADGCSEFREEEEGLKMDFSSLPSVGNDGVSFSHLGFPFWNHLCLFLISLSLLFPYLVVFFQLFLLYPFKFCFIPSIARFPLTPSVLSTSIVPYSLL